MLLSFVLTALQGCGADCRAALEESGLAYEKDGEEVEASKDCTISSGGDGTEAPGRLLEDLEDSIESKMGLIKNIEHLSKFRQMQADVHRAVQEGSKKIQGRALQTAKQMQEAYKDTCKDVQKVVDCWGGKDQALCACTCTELSDEDEPDCKFPCGDDNKEEEMPDITMKELIDCMWIEGTFKEMCKDAEGIDNSLSNPCGKED